MLTDGHCFFTYLISNLKNKLNNCNTFNEVIDNCVENVFEFHSLINLANGSRFCNSENFQVKSVYESLGKYLTNSVKRSDRLLKKKHVSLSEIYPVGFRDCIFILKRGHVVILPSR